MSARAFAHAREQHNQREKMVFTLFKFARTNLMPLGECSEASEPPRPAARPQKASRLESRRTPVSRRFTIAWRHRRSCNWRCLPPPEPTLLLLLLLRTDPPLTASSTSATPPAVVLLRSRVGRARRHPRRTRRHPGASAIAPARLTGAELASLRVYRARAARQDVPAARHRHHQHHRRQRERVCGALVSLLSLRDVASYTYHSLA